MLRKILKAGWPGALIGSDVAEEWFGDGEGIRKSLGATRGKILMQFLVESISLCVIGGVVGFAAGALWFSILFGVIFGMLPANKTAKLDPIQCLQWE